MIFALRYCSKIPLKQKQQQKNWHLFSYIFSLALADLLVILVCVPTSGVIYTFEEWIWGETMCRITEFGKDVFYGVSVFTLTALAAERYCAIVNPLRKLQVCNSKFNEIIMK